MIFFAGSTTNESKQHSIRKWLEDIPVLRVDEHCGPVSISVKSPKRIRSPTRSLPPDASSERALSPRPASEKALVRGANKSHHIHKHAKEKKIHKPKSPPPPTPPQTKNKPEGYYDTVPAEARMNLPPPDMIQEVSFNLILVSLNISSVPKE